MPVFQDDLFSSARVVERMLANGTVLRLKLEPLPGEQVRVLEYHRKAPGERWGRVPAAEGRTLRYGQLKLSPHFADLFPIERSKDQ